MLGERSTDGPVVQARRLLERFGCGALMDRRYLDCSQGERRRILLARALMRRPSLMLFDEPTGGLNLPSREALLRALAHLAAEQRDLATVTVTHHVEKLPGSTTHALLLRRGEVIASGPASEVLTEDRLSACFGVPVALVRLGDRWAAQARNA